MPFPSRASKALLSMILGATLTVIGCGQKDSYVAPEPPEVTVSPPTRRSVTDYVEYTGTTRAVETVDLRARVKGFLKERHFDEKTPVKKGQLLFVIDEEPFQVALGMAKARLTEAEAALKKSEQSKAKEVAAAQLDLDQAALVLARLDEKRNRNLLDRNAGTREALDQSEATRRKAEAQVKADLANLEQATADYQTNILAAKGNVDAALSDVRNAEINLGYCRITAPYDGRISRRYYDVGNLVGDGQATILATIYRDDPIYAYINISESDLLKFRQMTREGKRKDIENGDKIPLELGLANEVGFPHQGVIDYSDPAVDSASGTVLSRGFFANTDRVIVPGLFARIRVALEVKPNALLVPERALGTDQEGRFLLIVGDKDVVEKRKVRVGALEGNYRVIEENLKPEELVIVNGLQKARPESKVKPKRLEQPEQAIASSSNSPQH